MPTAFVDGTLTLDFGADAGDAFGALRKAENLRAIEDWLTETTENVRHLRAEAIQAPPEVSTSATLHANSYVPKSEEQAALQCEHIAQVVEIFKGKIVDVKHKVKS